MVQRDRHAELIVYHRRCRRYIGQNRIGIRHLQRTEVREAEEYFSP